MQNTDSNAALRNLSALVDFSNLINSSFDLDFILNNLLLTFFGKFHTPRGIIALYDEDGNLKIRSVKGISKEDALDFPELKKNKENFEDLKSFREEYRFPFMQKIFFQSEQKGVLLLGERLTKKNYNDEDKRFIETILNIGATAIENSLFVDQMKEMNKELDGKVNRLSALFDLSKEFSGILEVDMVAKLLVYSIIGQLLVTKFAVVTCDGDTVNILDSKIPHDELSSAFINCIIKNISAPVQKNEIEKRYEKLFRLGIELIIPMQIKGETKGAILLGSRKVIENYSKSDIEFISSVGSLAMISIENARLFKETIEKQRMEKDLELARNIQRSLLPSKFPKMNNFDIAAYSQSARQVGGDYYDLIKISKDDLLFAVGDVSGKGVQAALLMANLQAFLKSIAKQNFLLDEATNLINDLVSENTTLGNFITFFWAVVNDENLSLTYVNSGHNPPLLLRGGELRKLNVGGMLLGVMPTMVPYKSETLQLEKNDILFLYTDGISEAMDGSGNEYGEEKLESLIIKLNEQSSQQILNKILQSVQEHCGEAEQSDDITCMVIKAI